MGEGGSIHRWKTLILIQTVHQGLSLLKPGIYIKIQTIPHVGLSKKDEWTDTKELRPRQKGAKWLRFILLYHTMDWNMEPRRLQLALPSIPLINPRDTSKGGHHGQKASRKIDRDRQTDRQTETERKETLAVMRGCWDAESFLVYAHRFRVGVVNKDT